MIGVPQRGIWVGATMKCNRRGRNHHKTTSPGPKLQLEHLELREMMAADSLTAAPLANLAPALGATQSAMIDLQALAQASASRIILRGNTLLIPVSSAGPRSVD